MEDLVAAILSGAAVPTWPRWVPPLAIVGEGVVAEQRMRFRAPPAGATVWADVDDVLALYLLEPVKLVNLHTAIREQLRRHYAPSDIRVLPEAGGINALAALILLGNAVTAGRLAAEATGDFLRAMGPLYRAAPNWPSQRQRPAADPGRATDTRGGSLSPRWV